MTRLELLGFSFADPAFLLLLGLIPLLSWLRGKQGGAPAVMFSSAAVLRSIGRAREGMRGWFSSGLTYLGVALLIVGLARPQKGESSVQTEASGIDIMLVLDVSRSMLAEDFTVGGRRANRLEAVKRVTREFIEGRQSDRIGMVAFAGRPYLVSPLTMDHDWLIKNLDRVRIGLVEDGTAIGSAIASASNRLRNLDVKSRVMVLLTDGDNNSGSIAPLTAAEAAAALGIRIYTIGAGSTGLSRIPVAEDPFGRPIYREIHLEFDETALQEIAAVTDGKYFRATDTASLEQIFDQIDALETTSVEVTRHHNYTDAFAWFVGAGGGLLTLSCILGLTVWRKFP